MNEDSLTPVTPNRLQFLLLGKEQATNFLDPPYKPASVACVNTYMHINAQTQRILKQTHTSTHPATQISAGPTDGPNTHTHTPDWCPDQTACLNVNQQLSKQTASKVCLLLPALSSSLYFVWIRMMVLTGHRNVSGD